jgi:hypothetical protein
MRKCFAWLILLFSLHSYCAEEAPVVVDREQALKDFKPLCNGKSVPEEQRSRPSPEIPQGRFTVEEHKRIAEVMVSQPQSIKDCVTTFTDDYADDVYEYCETNNLYPCIAGGCEHVLGYAALHDAVFIEALKSCGVTIDLKPEDD